MGARLPALHPADMQRGRIPVDLLPPQVDNLRCSQTMPVRCQDHSRVPVTVSVVGCRVDQLFDLSWSEVLPAAKLAVWPAYRCTCSFFGSWPNQLQVRFRHGFRPLPFEYLIV